MSLTVSILLNEPKGSCRAGLDRTLEGFGVTWSVLVQTSGGRDKICDIPGRTAQVFNLGSELNTIFDNLGNIKHGQ